MENQDFLEQIVNDLKTNEKYKSYFSKFTPESVESFITGFANTKVMYTQFAELFQKEREQTELGLLPEAIQCLVEIQNKKLFDKQCLWRSATIDIEGITNTSHFDYWEEYIFACPFITPATESDIELYVNYLNSTSDAVHNHEYTYQDYVSIKEAMLSEDDSVYPEWYQYYDTYKGTGMNIKLPNVRGEKEDFYRNLYFKTETENQKKEGTYQDYVPFNFDTVLSSYDETRVKEFVKLFGTPTDLELLEKDRKSVV